jgi:hypothetical protein
MDTGPCGTCAALKQRPTLDLLRLGLPLTFTRISDTSHCTLMQGLGIGGVAGIWKGQPLMRNVSAVVTRNPPPPFTRVLEEII